MTISFVNTSSDNGSSVTSLSASVPAGLSNGNLLLALVYFDGDPGTITPPSGWTLEASKAITAGNEFFLYSKIASGESGSYAWSWVTSRKARVQIGAWSGDINTSEPIESVSNDTYTSFSTALRAGSISVSETDQDIIFFGAASSTTSKSFTAPTNPATFTEDIDTGDTTSDSWFSGSHLTWSSSGSTGNIDATISASLSDKHAFGVLLNIPAEDSPVALLLGWGL